METSEGNGGVELEAGGILTCKGDDVVSLLKPEVRSEAQLGKACVSPISCDDDSVEARGAGETYVEECCINEEESKEDNNLI
ncbi:putative transcriptional regulatory protein NadR [Corchorus olitorius]|uniref:Transcriptional regulatory protein NadR n=1 Tax=Corchorus olitorius TaxID=93759 RepID=A0A1R3GPX9_9ROSI|nr:putative transcriptional regulatory protein NadR [Corchorus olitorius]